MSYLIIIIVALAVASLTFFSGFGLGTILMPAFALFFPVEVAVAATALVHFANNIFKLILVGKHSDWKTVWIFGLPAVAFSFLGAFLLNYLSDIEPIYQYSIQSKTFNIEIIKIVISVLLIIFAIFELHPRFSQLTFGRKYLALGGTLSGFFGGLSGMQGALRAAFLSKSGLKKEQFVGTSVTTSCMVDFTRISVYGFSFFRTDMSVFHDSTIVLMIIAGTISALAGALIGKMLLKKITLKTIQTIVGIMLLVVAVFLGLGMI